ncbi:hypothetical protein [Microbacterium sp. 16-032]|uniref:hypothetical protein n=1 Tax=Microbacterium sp. 16-032 TaxID=3239808 RepID=UPI0034E1B243
MTDASTPRSPQIANREEISAPDGFSQAPIDAINSAIQADSSVQLFLNAAQFALSARTDTFTQRVGVKAVDIAGKRNARAVDVPDVEKATEALYPETDTHVSPWKWGVLGIVAGAVLSFLIGVITPQIENEWVPLLTVAAIVLLIACAAWAIRLIVPRKRS